MTPPMNTPTKFYDRGVPYHAESTLSSAQVLKWQRDDHDPIHDSQSHLAALEIASSSDTTSDLSVRAGSVSVSRSTRGVCPELILL